MGLVARLLGTGRMGYGKEQGISPLQATTRERTRREVIAMAVRDTLKKHGLPAGSITADALPGFTPTGHPGVHIQLVFRGRQPSLMAYAVALESAVQACLQRLDPLSPSWIVGMSWRFEPEDRTVWPNLPIAGKTDANAACERTSDRGQPAVALQGLLRAREEAYFPAAGGQAIRANAFSPTLPLPT
jgi:hypothetical protein